MDVTPKEARSASTYCLIEAKSSKPQGRYSLVSLVDVGFAGDDGAEVSVRRADNTARYVNPAITSSLIPS